MQHRDAATSTDTMHTALVHNVYRLLYNATPCTPHTHNIPSSFKCVQLDETHSFFSPFRKHLPLPLLFTSYRSTINQRNTYPLSRVGCQKHCHRSFSNFSAGIFSYQYGPFWLATFSSQINRTGCVETQPSWWPTRKDTCERIPTRRYKNANCGDVFRDLLFFYPFITPARPFIIIIFLFL